MRLSFGESGEKTTRDKCVALAPADVYSFCSDNGCCRQGEVGPQGLSGREGHWGALGNVGERGPKGEKGHIGLMVSRAACSQLIYQLAF